MFAEVAVRYKAQIVEGAREKQREAVTSNRDTQLFITWIRISHYFDI